MKKNKDIEIEIQVKIENVKPLLTLLEKKGEFQSKNHQKDEYFGPVHRDFLKQRPVKEWLRLRDSDGVFSINYKNWHFDKKGNGLYCDEYESKIEDLEKIKRMFKALNYKSLVVVDKVRKIWKYRDYEISIDKVKGLGDFVEVEYKSKDKRVDPPKVVRKMIEFLKEVGCGKIERDPGTGYPFKLLFPKQVKYAVQ